MTFRPDGSLYVSKFGFGPPPMGFGEILKIRIRDESELRIVAADLIG
jgi:hypothetical protein